MWNWLVGKHVHLSIFAVVASAMAVAISVFHTTAPAAPSAQTARPKTVAVAPNTASAEDLASRELSLPKPRPSLMWCDHVDGDKQSGTVTVDVSTNGCRVRFEPKVHSDCVPDPKGKNPPTCTRVYPWDAPPTCTVVSLDSTSGEVPFDPSGVTTTRDVLIVPGAHTGHKFRYTCKTK